jgi:type IV pilus assembly protein PilE
MPTKLQTGFTLLELIIVVAIISILASIAIPAYNGYVETSKRSDAQASLMALAIAQEKYRAQCPSYAQNFGSAINCDTSSLIFCHRQTGIITPW